MQKNENKDIILHCYSGLNQRYLCYQAMMLGQNSCPERTECFQAGEYLTESCE